MSSIYKKLYTTTKSVALAAALTIVFSIPAHKDDIAKARSKLSMTSIIMFALDNNPDIEMSKSKADQAGFAVDEAKASFYPQVELDGEWGREYNDPSGGSEEKKGKPNSSSRDSRGLKRTFAHQK